jgi:hypothetical protein
MKNFATGDKKMFSAWYKYNEINSVGFNHPTLDGIVKLYHQYKEYYATLYTYNGKLDVTKRCEQCEGNGFLPKKTKGFKPQKKCQTCNGEGLLPLTIVENTVLNELMNG